MKRLFAASAILVFLLPAYVNAFDGMRKGFVLGGGLGFAPVAKWEADKVFTDSLGQPIKEDKAGVGLNLMIGFAWDEQNMIVYEGNVTGYESDIIVWAGQKQTVSQGFNGISWYHYLGPQGKSYFTTIGIGLYVFDTDDLDQNDPGAAFLVGGGYEFARHFQVGGYISAGKTSDAGVDFKHSHINILVSAVAF